MTPQELENAINAGISEGLVEMTGVLQTMSDTFSQMLERQTRIEKSLMEQQSHGHVLAAPRQDQERVASLHMEAGPKKRGRKPKPSMFGEGETVSVMHKGEQWVTGVVREYLRQDKAYQVDFDGQTFVTPEFLMAATDDQKRQDEIAEGAHHPARPGRPPAEEPPLVTMSDFIDTPYQRRVKKPLDANAAEKTARKAAKRQELSAGIPYTHEQLVAMKRPALTMLAALLEVDPLGKSSDQLHSEISESQQRKAS